MGNPAWRSDRHESGLGKPVIHGPGRRADSGDLLLVWLQEQLGLTRSDSHIGLRNAVVQWRSNNAPRGRKHNGPQGKKV